ncbi:MAG: type VII toxin-antitoxin system HepT family RNase toxin [Caldisericia bacterium]
MNRIPINKEIIIKRISIIEDCLQKLEKFKNLSFEEFLSGENFAISEHYLRRALEAEFDIGNHILSKIPGVRVTTYKEIAIELGKQKILPKDFVENKLIKMAGYRNRLIHFYSEITEDELYRIIKDELNDFKKFLKYIKPLLKI